MGDRWAFACTRCAALVHEDDLQRHAEQAHGFVGPVNLENFFERRDQLR